MVKIIFEYVLVAIFFVGVAGAEVKPNFKGNTISVPGTGVRLELPPEFIAMPLGTLFIDTFGETTILLVAGGASNSFENDSAYRVIFPDAPEKFRSSFLAGNLYKRTRARSGGKWDGWWLSVTRAGIVLEVQIFYTGKSVVRFEGLKSLFSKMEWNESELDTELAFGGGISVPKLHLVSNVFGALRYTENGQAKGSGSEIFVSAMAILPSQGKAAMPAGCAPGFSKAFKGESYSGPHYLNRNGIVFCDAWKTEQSGSVKYMALLLMPNGAVLNVIGSGNANEFRAALLNFRLIRIPSTKGK